jgi:AMP-polyphosphate phosphotransferase
MFEAAELGHKTSKREYARQLPGLRAQLLEAQQALKEKGVPVVVVVAGLDGAGKGDVVNRLSEWLDPRGLDTHTFWHPTDEERERPPWWRFWRVLPPRGRIAILFGGWYGDLLLQRAEGEIKGKVLDRELDRIAAFEQMLAADGSLLVKLWFHLSKKGQRQRLKNLEASSPTHWRLLPNDWKHHEHYDRFAKTAERILRRTSTGPCPWHVIEAIDDRYRDLTAGRVLLEAFRHATNGAAVWPAPSPPPPEPKVQSESSLTILHHVDLTRRLGDAEYARSIGKLQRKLSRLVWMAHDRKRSVVLVFEGWDAAGKGSSIRRLTEAMDARLCRIIPIAAPTDEEKAHHYLWRFWRHLPRAGRVTIFDRSWYGRVLVERVEGFAREEEWRRAYHEINDFEEQLAGHGIVPLKFWVHISSEEQLRRFKERERIAHKRYKITAEDWRNRKQWRAYEAAVNDMVANTSTEFAPWTLVAGNDKKFARIQILKAVCRRLEEAL